MHIERDVYIPMRDGVCLSADIYRANPGERGPVVLMRTPYLKSGAMTGDGLNSTGRPAPIPTGLRPASNPFELPFMLSNLSPLMEAGYTVVVSDVRGSGHSEGVYDYYNLESGPMDGYDTVEWMATQPWCDGNVGMTGGSAMAIYCYQAAVEHPPHLKAMWVNMHPADFYFDQWFVGGVFRWENRIGWCTMMLKNIAPQNPGSPSDPNYEAKRQVYEQRYAQAYDRMLQGQNAANQSWLTEMYQHREYDDFWRARSYAERHHEVDVPVFHGGVWYDHFIRGTLTAHAEVNVPKRLIIGPGWLGAPPEAGDGDIGALQVGWFDHYLRGKDNGILEGPAARLYRYGDERWIDEAVWPVPVTETSYYLAAGPGGGAQSLNDGLLATEPSTSNAVFELVHDPARPVTTPQSLEDQRDFERGCLTFSTPSLAQDVEIIGSARLVLYASTDASDVDFCVRLCDVYEDGRSRLLNTGALKGSHFRSHENPEALQAGRLYEFEIEIWATANLFLKGHRIRVDVSASDFPFFEVNPVVSRTEIVVDAAHPSRLVLPVVKREA